LDEIEWDGRTAFIIFDSDSCENTSVKRAEKALAEELSGRGATVRIIRLQGKDNQKVGLDDYLVAHKVIDLLQLPQENPQKKKNDPGTKVSHSQGAGLVELASGLYLFHDQNKEAFAFLNGEAIPLRSKKMRQWLARQYYANERRTPNTDALNQAIVSLEGEANFARPGHFLYNRVASAEGSFWFDLGTEKAVQINQKWLGGQRCPGYF
jgi:hypothetical protein